MHYIAVFSTSVPFEIQPVFRDIHDKRLQTHVEFLRSTKVTETTKKMEEVNANLLKENQENQCELLQEKEARSETLRILRNYKLRYWHPCLQSLAHSNLLILILTYLLLILTRIEYLEKLNEKMENFVHDQLWNSGQVITKHCHLQ